MIIELLIKIPRGVFVKKISKAVPKATGGSAIGILSNTSIKSFPKNFVLDSMNAAGMLTANASTVDIVAVNKVRPTANFISSEKRAEDKVMGSTKMNPDKITIIKNKARNTRQRLEISLNQFFPPILLSRSRMRFSP